VPARNREPIQTATARDIEAQALALSAKDRAPLADPDSVNLSIHRLAEEELMDAAAHDQKEATPGSVSP
jgi:hypothetical protein